MSAPMMNRGHSFSILVLFYLLTEFDTVDFPLLIETQSGFGLMNATSLLFSSPLMITPQSPVLVPPQISDLHSGVCIESFLYHMQSCGFKLSMLITPQSVSPAHIFCLKFPCHICKFLYKTST